jgi:hypothetical protein
MAHIQDLGVHIVSAHQERLPSLVSLRNPSDHSQMALGRAGLWRGASHCRLLYFTIYDVLVELCTPRLGRP